MNIRTAAVLSALVSSYLSGNIALADSMTTIGASYAPFHTLPGERLLAGTQRGVPLFVTGVTDTFMAPVTLARQVTDETKNYGALGIVSGTVRGSFKAAGQLLQGAGRGLMGFFDVLTAPMGGLD